MRHIDEMTHEEIIGLTDDELKLMVDFRCAEEGIRLLKAPVCPIEPQMKVDSEVFKVEDIVTTNKELAQQLSLMLMENEVEFGMVEYDYQLGSKYTYYGALPSYRDGFGKIAKVSVFSRDMMSSHATELADYKQKKEIYEPEKKAFDESVKERQTLADWVYDIYNTHVSRERGLSHSKDEFSRYLKLANGDAAIAWGFYDKAYKPEPWTSYHLRAAVGIDVDIDCEPEFDDNREDDDE